MKIAIFMAFSCSQVGVFLNDTNLYPNWRKSWYWYRYWYFPFWKVDTDTDTILSSSWISILIRYRYDTFLKKYRTFDTDTIVSKTSAEKIFPRSIFSSVKDLFSCLGKGNSGSRVAWWINNGEMTFTPCSLEMGIWKYIPLLVLHVRFTMCPKACRLPRHFFPSFKS